MVKKAGQLLAMFAMMASIISAQCNLTCALQAAVVSPSHHAGLQAGNSGHPCCPEQSQQPAQRQSCPDPAVISGTTDSAVEMSAAVSDSLPVTAVLFRNAPWPQRSIHRTTLRGATSLAPSSGFFILRV